MKMEQEQKQYGALIRFYLFLRNRDARIIELFFWALNVYIFALIIVPPYSVSGLRLAIRILFQLVTTAINTLALVTESKNIRMISAIANTAIMALITASLIYRNNPNAGTYALIGLLSAFVCWKINVK